MGSGSFFRLRLNFGQRQRNKPVMHGRPMALHHPTRVESDEARQFIGSWLNQHAAVMLAAALCAAATGSGAPIALAAAWSFMTFWYRYRRSSTRRCRGYANGLTALRLVLVLLAAAAMTRIPHTWLLVALAVNVAIDVADGPVARLTNAATPFGAVFDREADAVFVLVAYFYFFLQGGIAAGVVVLGLLPYAYRLLAAIRPVSVAPDRKERLATLLAGTNYVVLLVAIALPRQAPYVLLFSAAIVAWSFSVSFVKLYRNA